MHLKLVRHLNLSIQEVAATNHLHCRNPLLPFVVKLFQVVAGIFLHRQPSQSRQGFHHLTKTNKNVINMHHYGVFIVNIEQILFSFSDGSIVDFEQVNTGSESKYLMKVSNKVTKTVLNVRT